MSYIELHTASAFSFLQGASLPEALVERAAALGYPALALLDRDGVYGAPRFHKAALAAKIRPIIGAELTIAESLKSEVRSTSDSDFRLRTSYFLPARLPADAVEIAHPRAADGDAFSDEQRALQRLAAAVAAEAATGGDHAVAGHIAPAAALHDVANGARRARSAGELGDFAVRGDLPRRNAPYHREHAVREIRYCTHDSGWPSAFIFRPAMAASVGVRSAGVAGSV